MPDVPLASMPNVAGLIPKQGMVPSQIPLASQVAGFPQQAADLGISALGPLGEAGMTLGDMLRTGHVDPRDIPQVIGGVMMGVAAPEAEEAAPLEAGAQAIAKGIKAYHGSPYDFDKFDLSKIGTGEGAQAYGHGLYFAENPKVAQDYRQTLSDWPTTIRSMGFDVSDDAANALLRGNAANPGNTDRAAQVAQWQSPELRSIPRDKLASAIQTINERDRPGRTYQVSINADPEHFLDWDKPLSEQSPQVQQAILNHPAVQAAAQAEHFGYSPQEYAALTPERKAKLASMHMASTADFLSADSPILSRGDRLYRALSNAMEPLESANSTGAADASESLRQAGIPGIKYLDQGSRFNVANLPDNPITQEAKRFMQDAPDADTALTRFRQTQADNGYKDWGSSERGQIENVIRTSFKPQTSNYVLFDDKLVDILRKYGLAGLTGAGAVGAAAQQPSVPLSGLQLQQ